MESGINVTLTDMTNQVVKDMHADMDRRIINSMFVRPMVITVTDKLRTADELVAAIKNAKEYVVYFRQRRASLVITSQQMDVLLKKSSGPQSIWTMAVGEPVRGTFLGMDVEVKG